MADQRTPSSSRRKALGALAVLGTGLATGTLSPLEAQTAVTGRPVAALADTLGLVANDAGTPRAVTEALALSRAGRTAEGVTLLQDKVATLLKLSIGTRKHPDADLVAVKHVFNDAKQRIAGTLNQVASGKLAPEVARGALTKVCEDAIAGFSVLKA